MFTKYLDPKNDFAFKKIFGTEKNKDILIHFLNDMINFKDRGRFQEVIFLKSSQDPETVAKKTSVVDILCKDDNGNHYIVEMQVAKEKGFAKRAQYYASKTYSSQLLVGENYYDLKEIIFLAITDFVMFPNKKHFKSDHLILDHESHENDLEDFYFTFLELPKFNKNADELTNMIDKWTYFFKHAFETSKEDLKTIIGHDQIIERAYEELERIAWSDIELLKYESAEKQQRDYDATMDQKYDEGRAEGKAEGKAEEKIEIAKKMLKKGLSIQDVMEVTGLSKQEIQSLSTLQE